MTESVKLTRYSIHLPIDLDNCDNDPIDDLLEVLSFLLPEAVVDYWGEDDSLTITLSEDIRG